MSEDQIGAVPPGHAGDPGRTQLATMSQAVAVSVIAVLPAFLVGALAVQIRTDFEFGPAELGVVTAMMFAVTAALSAPMGRVVQRLGAARGIVIATIVSAVSLAGIGLATSFAVLLVAMCVAGIGNALAPPAANLSISNAFGTSNLGLAFGIKQSSIPIATLLGGLAVPAVSLSLGWRWVLGIAAVGALVVSVLGAVRHFATTARTAGTGDPDRGLPRAALVVLTLGGGLGAAAATSLGVFFVAAGVGAGLPAGRAGLWFAVCSGLGLAGRIGLGWAVDRVPGRSTYVLIANLLALGGLGHALLAQGGTKTFVIGSLLAYGAGWTWTGLFHFAIVKDNRLAAATSTGLVQTGLSLGSASGPLGFGLVAHVSSYGVAWMAAAVVSLLAAAAIRVGRRMVRRSRGLPSGPRRRAAS